jgi:circadian clock protein KaiC
MRYVEPRSQLHRMISVLKVRDAEINCALHRFTISGNGIVIEPDSTAAEEILAQVVRQDGYQGRVRARATGNGSED